MELREPTREDAPAIAELLNAQSEALFGEPVLTEAQVRDWFALPDIWIRLAEAEGRPVGYVDVSEEAGRWNIDLRALDVAAARVLLDASCEHVGTDGVARGYAPSEDTVAAAAYRDAGFEVIRHSFQMRIELDACPAEPVFPTGIEVRPMREGEEERIHAAHMETFAELWGFHEQTYEQWRVWQRDRTSFNPELWYLALEGDELAGFALCAPAHSGEPDFGWVELLGVRPAWRRRGLGEALLRHSFREMYARGFTRIGLGVDAENATGAVKLYERVGMHQVRRNDTWERQR